MQSISWVLFLAIGLIAFLALIFLLRLLRRVQHKHATQVKEALAGKGIVTIAPDANFFGQRSKGPGQIRGNGIWALTPNRIYFRLFVPRREIEIPLDWITVTRRAKSFLGKVVVGVELLVVEFTNETGQTDEMAWALSDVESLQRRIENAARNSLRTD